MTRFPLKRYPMKRISISWRFTEIPSAIADFIRNFSFRNIKDLFYEYRTIIFGIGAGLIVTFIVILLLDFRNVRNLSSVRPNVTTRIFDKNGILISELFTQKREVVSYDKIPKQLVNAVIAIEDNEFHEHFGINPKGIVRAFFINIFSGRIKQGGSTITQQLSKIMLTTRQRNLYRKIKEAFISLMIEATYSKEEIMGMYLNQIFLGHGTYGVETAARFYFNKHVWELDTAECALLATLPSAPNKLSPIRHPKTSIQRHKIVLAKMVELGYITVDEAETAFMNFWPKFLKDISDMPPTATAFSNRVDRAPWFSEYIRRELIKKYGQEMVYEKGLSVYTTLDINKQEAGQNILRRALVNQTKSSASLSFRNEDYITDNFADEISLLSDLFSINLFSKKGSRENLKVNTQIRDSVMEELEVINYLVGADNVSKFLDTYKQTYADDKELQSVEGCIISIDHRTGYIEAMIGGSDFSSLNQLNRTMQSRRQPGSAIKPLLYAAAMESGKFTPATAVLDSPIVYLDNEGGDWIPENYDGEFYGLVRLRKALALSINVISIRIADEIGIDYVSKHYQKLLNIDRKRIKRDFSIALGSVEVSPYELTRAYAVIANGGQDVIPFSIRYIKDNDDKIIENREEEVNKIIEKRKKEGTLQIIKPETAQLMISILKSVINAGTGGAANPGRPAGGKTGTTNNWKDAWFVGFVPQLTTGVWIGYDKLGLSLGINQSGGGVAAPVWGDYMSRAMNKQEVLDFPSYAGLSERKVCERSGMLPSSICRETLSEVFNPRYIPEKECDVCASGDVRMNFSKKGPRENISSKQKKNVIKSINRDNSDKIINDIGQELLR